VTDLTQPQAEHSIQLRIDSDPATLAPARKAVEFLCVRGGFAPDAAAEVGLSLNEALANIIRHAYEDRTDRPIDVAGEVHQGQLVLRLRDWGNGTMPRPRPQVDPLNPGGLGLVCMRSLMDSIEFQPQPDGMLLVMTRRVDRPARPT
jgi:serine/threonine-protein kinase RsbW